MTTSEDFHIDRLEATLRELWAANNLDLHMCDDTIKKGQFGLLHDIRTDVRVLLARLRPAAGEAVAWRYKSKAKNAKWTVQKNKPAHAFVAECEVEPLFAHPAPPAVAETGGLVEPDVAALVERLNSPKRRGLADAKVIREAAAALSQLQARVDELEGAAMFDKAIFAGERTLRQRAVTRALEAEAERDAAHEQIRAMTTALELWAAYDDILRRFEGPATILAGDIKEIDDAYDKCVSATRAILSDTAEAAKEHASD